MILVPDALHFQLPAQSCSKRSWKVWGKVKYYHIAGNWFHSVVLRGSKCTVSAFWEHQCISVRSLWIWIFGTLQLRQELLFITFNLIHWYSEGIFFSERVTNFRKLRNTETIRKRETRRERTLSTKPPDNFLDIPLLSINLSLSLISSPSFSFCEPLFLPLHLWVMSEHSSTLQLTHN